jgi:hypothetical protein
MKRTSGRGEAREVPLWSALATKEGKMIVPGVYFRNETIWRGRVAAFTCDLKAALYELGFWVGLLYVAAYVSPKWEFVPLAVGTAVCVRMLIGFLSEVEERKRITKDIERHFDEAYPRD